jgi:hypothetical protein
MRKSSTYTFVCAVMSAAVWASAPASAALTMLCRGGPMSMEARTTDLVGNFGITVWFKRWIGPKTSIRTDGSHLAPGECSLAILAIPESWGSRFYYRTFADNFYWSIYMGQTADSHSATSSAWLRLNPLSTDPNLLFVPPISATPDVNSIYDPNIVWRLRVDRADGYLELVSVDPR